MKLDLTLKEGHLPELDCRQAAAGQVMLVNQLFTPVNGLVTARNPHNRVKILWRLRNVLCNSEVFHNAFV